MGSYASSYNEGKGMAIAFEETGYSCTGNYWARSCRSVSNPRCILVIIHAIYSLFD